MYMHDQYLLQVITNAYNAHTHMYVCMYVGRYACMCTCMRMYVCMYICMFLSVMLCMSGTSVCLSACLWYLCKNKWMHVCVYVCMYVCMCVCMYVHMYLCMYVCMYKHVAYTYIHVRLYVNIQIYVYRSTCSQYRVVIQCEQIHITYYDSEKSPSHANPVPPATLNPNLQPEALNPHLELETLTLRSVCARKAWPFQGLSGTTRPGRWRPAKLKLGRVSFALMFRVQG